MTTEKLFTDFPPNTAGEWKEKIIQDLKGADFDRKLRPTLPEGIQLNPFYRREDLEKIEGLADRQTGEPPFCRSPTRAGNQWEIRQDFYTPDLKKANQQIKTALENGVQAVGLYFTKQEGEPGLPVDSGGKLSPENWASLLEGIHLDFISLHLTGPGATVALNQSFLESPPAKNILARDAAALRGSGGIDLLVAAAQTGFSVSPEGWQELAQFLTGCRSSAPAWRPLVLNADIWSAAGAHTALELGLVLGDWSESLFQLGQHKVDLTGVVDQTAVKLAVGPRFFTELAKFRAIRPLLFQIWQSYLGSEPEGDRTPEIQAVTSAFYSTLYDPWVNMLRGTTSAMSAALGTADMVSVLPYDYRLSSGGDFGQRIARNVQHLMKHESYLDKVADPAAGSYYVETLTDQLAEQAWKLFQELEGAGGLAAALEKGVVAEKLAVRLAKTFEAVRGGKLNLLGTNHYPNPLDDLHKKNTPARLKPVVESRGDTDFEPVRPFFPGAELEGLRTRVEESGQPPKVLPLLFGHPAMRSARSNFLLNFFNCAGFEVLKPVIVESVAEFEQAVKENPADILGFCSSDKEYAPFLKEYLGQKKPGFPLWVIAGYPKEDLEQLTGLGVEKFVHLKSDLITELTWFFGKAQEARA